MPGHQAYAGYPNGYTGYAGHCQVGDLVRPKGMISESIRRRGISVGEVSYKGHRYPAEIIAHCVWLYHRLPLSFREVEELMLVRGVIVS